MNQIWKQKRKYPKRRQFTWDTCTNIAEWKFPIILNSLHSLQKEVFIHIAKKRLKPWINTRQWNIIREDHKKLNCWDRRKITWEIPRPWDQFGDTCTTKIVKYVSERPAHGCLNKQKYTAWGTRDSYNKRL